MGLGITPTSVSAERELVLSLCGSQAEVSVCPIPGPELPPLVSASGLWACGGAGDRGR